jgi:conjugative relaxase-like TrwC/TraI family protein
LEAGTPPGRWLGGGLAGLSEGGLRAGGEVSHLHMERLFGAGADPVSGARLGGGFPRYRSAAERIGARVARLDSALGAAERGAAVARIEGEEMAKKQRRAVVGYDFTFSVPKSVSALWAVADAGTQELIAAAHHAAVIEVLGFLERRVAETRTGAKNPATGAVEQAPVRGLVAACFDHWDSRAGDPQLHSHLAISAKAETVADVRWRALDGRPMHAAVVAVSELYNAVLADRIAGSFGLAWGRRERGRDRNAGFELAAVPEELCREFSSRSRQIDESAERLITGYRERHGRDPSPRAAIRMRQHATLAPRPSKQVRPLAQMADEWRERAGRALGCDAAAWAREVVAAGLPAPMLRADDVPLGLVEQIGVAVMGAVGDRRATWRRWNLHAEATRQTMHWRFQTLQDRETVLDAITDAAERASVGVTPAPAVTPAEFRRGDGSTRLRPVGSTVFTSQALWDAEERLLALANRTGARGVDLAVLDAVIEHHDGPGLAVSPDQAEALTAIAASNLSVDLLVGPAGAGKTTTLRTLRRAWEHAHGPGTVTGLAPSAAAAEVLARELGIRTENTAKWASDHQHGRAGSRPGGLVIIDEATMCGTLTLERICQAAAQAGAKVLLVGDPAQLQSVEAGGAFALLAAQRDDTSELADIHRFANDWEKLASLDLRHGHPEAIDTYIAHGRVKEGDAEQVTEAAYQAWLRDTDAGRTSVLIAETRATVTALNQRARRHRVTTGQVDPSRSVALEDGSRASRGDIVTTRRNDRRLIAGRTGWVRNGDQWTVTRVHQDGSLTVRRLGRRAGGAVILPAAYVAGNLDLGYATTVHRSQGVTVDTAHAIITPAATRELLYVAMTRGRQSNTAYVATDQPDPLHDAPAFGAAAATGRSVLGNALSAVAAEPSAHQAAAREREAWHGIGQLAAEYEAIANAAGRAHYANLISNSGLGVEAAEQVTANPHSPALVRELRRIDAAGANTHGLLGRAAPHVERAENPAAALTRIAATTKPGRGGPNTSRPRLIAGLIPEANHPMAADMRAALDQRAALIRDRAGQLAQKAIEGREPWLRELGPVPGDRDRARQWRARAATIAAYRDRWNHTGPEAIRPNPASQQERIDAARARRALPPVPVSGHFVPPARQAGLGLAL